MSRDNERSVLADIAGCLLGTLAYNCGPGVVNKSSILKKLKSGDRNIFKAYTSHCRYKGKFHKQLHQRRLTEIALLFVRHVKRIRELSQTA